MNFLEIKHLRMIRAIAETGNMTRSAERLALSQSALSQQLKDIENKLGVDLFFRTRKKMLLTPTGEKLLLTADTVVDQLDNAELEILEQTKGKRGELKVGTQCIFCFRWLPRIIETYRQRFADIEFEIGTSHDFAAELLRKKYDVVITALSVDDDNFSHVPLFRDQLVCIMNREHPLSSRKYIRFEDFREMSVISPAEKEENRFYQMKLRPMGIEPRRFMTVGQPQAIMELVASGFGVTIFPMWALRSTLAATKALIVRPITPKGFPLTWSAAFLRTGNMPTYQKEFIEMLRDMEANALNGYDQVNENGLRILPLPLVGADLSR